MGGSHTSGGLTPGKKIKAWGGGCGSGGASDHINHFGYHVKEMKAWGCGLGGASDHINYFGYHVK